ncbi:MAG: Rpn family recombination-promoting nuclease/putative transposase [Treponema sp.]|nr:Rpn family recombination-promoting nuclease/putative transposase [Treponema sp.]
MSSKDTAEKILEAYNDVFADIVNALLFNGRQIIDENALTDAQPFSMYKMDGDVRSQERDVAKYWNNDCIRIGFCGIENQSVQDADMPLRVISYDGAAYRAQLVQKPQDKKPGEEIVRYPVVTLVLYFGTEHRWNTAKTLHSRLAIDENLKPFVSDYMLNVFELAWLSDEQIETFRSDFREVVEYLRACRLHMRYEGSDRQLSHVQEILELFRVLSGNDVFKDVEPIILAKKNRTGGMRMYDVFTEMQEKSKKDGITLGQDTLLALFSKLYAAGRDDDVRRATNDNEYLKKLMDEYQK